MAKVTSKFQVTVPKVIADRYRIRPGDDITWEEAGDVIRVVPGSPPKPKADLDARLRLFDRVTQELKRSARKKPAEQPASRGWTREDLYTRGRPR